MGKAKKHTKEKITSITKYLEAIDIEEGASIFGSTVEIKDIYRNDNETFDRVRFTLSSGEIKEFRSKNRVPTEIRIN